VGEPPPFSVCHCSSAQRHASRRIVVASLADTVGFGALSESERNAWNSAVGYYQRAVAPRDVVFDSSLVAVRGGRGTMHRINAGRQRSYRCWLDTVITVAAQESSAFHTKWSSTPVRVDVDAYMNWAGAYTTDYVPFA
jgi:hypothetical protein